MAVKTAAGKVYKGYVWPGDCAFPDFTMEKTRDWWAGLYKDFMAQGTTTPSPFFPVVLGLGPVQAGTPLGTPAAGVTLKNSTLSCCRAPQRVFPFFLGFENE